MSTDTILTDTTGMTDNSFPTTTMDTAVGQTQVGDKSFDITGQVVDSTGDTPIDVNAVQGVTELPQGSPLDFGEAPFAVDADANAGGGPAEPVQENPEQTFVPTEDTQ